MYVKLFTSIFQGSLRGQPNLLLVFINLLTHADRSGCVDVHWRAIADEVGISEQDVRAAITALESPDPESRSRAEEGRRIIRLDPHRTWGWQIVNYCKYREIRHAEERKDQNREAQRRRRSKADMSAPVSTGQRPSASSAHAEAEAEAEGGGDAHARDSRTAPPPPGENSSRPTEDRRDPQPARDPERQDPEASAAHDTGPVDPPAHDFGKTLRHMGLSSQPDAAVEWESLLAGRGKTPPGPLQAKALAWILRQAKRQGIAVRYARDAAALADQWADRQNPPLPAQELIRPRPPPPPPGSALALALERRQGRELQGVAS